MPSWEPPSPGCFGGCGRQITPDDPTWLRLAAFDGFDELDAVGAVCPSCIGELFPALCREGFPWIEAIRG